MTNFDELLQILSVPRPNGSRAERETRRALVDWLDRRGIPYRIQKFRRYPYFFESIGVWLIFSRTLLAAAFWLRWGWPALVIALAGLLGATLDVLLHIPLVSWPGANRGENIIVEFDPDDARREVILTAHYDSKTELLDHRQRMVFLKSLPSGILITLLLGLLGPFDRWLRLAGSEWAAITFGLGAVLTLPLLFLAWGLGLNLVLGRFLPQSQGAVDNGAACAILLGLAECFAKNPSAVPQATKVTLALFTGEEVNLQGSRAYTRSRGWPLPTKALNLEAMAQDGDYVLWEEDGDVFRRIPTSSAINRIAASAVAAETGQPPRFVGPIISDGASFLLAGVPATTLGTYDRRLVDTGFHKPSDNLQRVKKDRLSEGVQILKTFLEKSENQRNGKIHRTAGQRQNLPGQP